VQPFGWSGGRVRDVERRGYLASQWNSTGTESVEVADWAYINPPNNEFTCVKAAGRQLPQGLRVVRHLPVRAELSEPDEAWGQVLDKPPGRKPRERADAGQQDR
jgi:hypothetical protein